MQAGWLAAKLYTCMYKKGRSGLDGYRVCSFIVVVCACENIYLHPRQGTLPEYKVYGLESRAESGLRLNSG